MIAEPYICIKGKRLGTIWWFDADAAPPLSTSGEDEFCMWIPYADFEREKLAELADEDEFGIWFDKYGYETSCHNSKTLIEYDYDDWLGDTESNRLLERAEFLKAVCEKEGVEWLPEKTMTILHSPNGSDSWFAKHWNEYKKETDIVKELCGDSEEKTGSPEFMTHQCPNCGEISEHRCSRCHEWIPEPRRDYYTKAEIDERIEVMLNLMDVPKYDEKEFRSRFLP